MRILSCSDVPHHFVAGSSSFVRQLACGLRERGHTLGVVCASRRLGPERYAEPCSPIYGVSSFPSVLHPAFRISFPIGIRHQLVDLFDDFRPDLVHIQSHGPLPMSVAKLARRRGLPVVGTNHFVPANIIHQVPIPRWLHALVIRTMWSHLHAIYKRLDALTTPTGAARDTLRASGFDGDVQVISNGVDLTRFNPQPLLPHVLARVRHAYGIRDRLVLLTVGRLDPEKNTAFLLTVLPLVRQTVDAQLVIVGTGTMERRLRSLVRKCGLEANVVFTGYLPDEDLPAMYQLANCFVMPGTAELQGIALMEAMATGLPVVAADALALPELVQSGRNGFLVDPCDAEAAAQRITEILGDPAKQRHFGESSRGIAETHRMTATVDAFLSLYTMALSTRR